VDIPILNTEPRAKLHKGGEMEKRKDKKSAENRLKVGEIALILGHRSCKYNIFNIQSVKMCPFGKMLPVKIPTEFPREDYNWDGGGGGRGRGGDNEH